MYNLHIPNMRASEYKTGHPAAEAVLTRTNRKVYTRPAAGLIVHLLTNQKKDHKTLIV